MSVFICIQKPHLCFFLETSSRLEGAAVLNDDADHFRLVFTACDQGHGPGWGCETCSENQLWSFASSR